MVLHFELIDQGNPNNVARTIVEVQSMEYDFNLRAMMVRSSGLYYYKRMSLPFYKRLCDSMLQHADFRSGRMIELNNYGSFIKAPVANGKVTPEQWMKMLASTAPDWDTDLLKAGQ